MALDHETVEDLDLMVSEYAQIAVEEAYLRHFQAGRTIILSKDGQLIRRQLGTEDVILKKLLPRRKVTHLHSRSV